MTLGSARDSRAGFGVLAETNFYWTGKSLRNRERFIVRVHNLLCVAASKPCAHRNRLVTKKAFQEVRFSVITESGISLCIAFDLSAFLGLAFDKCFN